MTRRPWVHFSRSLSRSIDNSIAGVVCNVAVGVDSGSVCAAARRSAVLRGGARVRVLLVQAAKEEEHCSARGQQHLHADRVPHDGRGGRPAVGLLAAALLASPPTAAANAAATTSNASASNSAATANLLVQRGGRWCSQRKLLAGSECDF